MIFRIVSESPCRGTCDRITSVPHKLSVAFASTGFKPQNVILGMTPGWHALEALRRAWLRA